MDSSTHSIIRDENGYFRHSGGYPLVVIFDSKDGGAKDKPDDISWQEPIIGLQTQIPEKSKEDTIPIQSKKAKADTQPLKFVNYDKSRRTKRLPRTRVRKEGDEGLLSAHTTLSKKMLQSNPGELAPPQAMSLSWQPFSSSDPLSTFPVNMEPHMYPLMHSYLSITTNPTISNPFKSSSTSDLITQDSGAWFPLAMTDAALFHLLLCGAALFVDLQTGRRESLQKLKHMKEAIHLLSARLQNPGSELSESTFVAVAHLAEYGCIAGNFDNWSLHIDGLYKMVQIRGGLKTLSDVVKNKVLRAELTGSIGILSKPRFTARDISCLSPSYFPLQQPTPALNNGFQNILEISDFNNDLINMLNSLQHLTTILNTTTPQLSILTLDQIFTPLQYHLLIFQFSDHQNPQSAALEELCCLGCLIYVETIYRFHISLNMDRLPKTALSTNDALIRKLKSCFEYLDLNNTNTTQVTQTKELSLWILFIGGIAVTGTRERAWLVARLVKLVRELQIYSWEDVRLLLKRFWWIDRILEDDCRDLWDEVWITVTVIFGDDSLVSEDL